MKVIDFARWSPPPWSLRGDMPTTTIVGGWSDEDLLVANDFKELECSICLMVMRDAVMCARQHSCCELCLKAADSVCPLCRQQVASPSPNLMARSFIDRLRVRCGNASGGCDAALTVGTFAGHALQCDFVLLACPQTGCAARLPRSGLAAHAAACPFAMLRCAQCKASYLRHAEAAHSCVVHLLDRVRQLELENAALRKQGAAAPPPKYVPSLAAFPYFGHWQMAFHNADLVVCASNGHAVEIWFADTSNGWFKIDGRTIFPSRTHGVPFDVAVDERARVPYALPHVDGPRNFALFTNAQKTELYIYTNFRDGQGKEMVLLKHDSAEVVFRSSAMLFSKVE